MWRGNAGGEEGNLLHVVHMKTADASKSWTNKQNFLSEARLFLCPAPLTSASHRLNLLQRLPATLCRVVISLFEIVITSKNAASPWEPDVIQPAQCTTALILSIAPVLHCFFKSPTGCIFRILPDARILDAFVE